MTTKKITKKAEPKEKEVEKCPVCKGYGRISPTESCDACKGTGKAN